MLDHAKNMTVTVPKERATHGRLRIPWLALGLALLAYAATASAQQRVAVPSRPGVTEPIYVTEVASAKANIILFPGGNGLVATSRNNFLIRVAARFAAAGMTVVVFDSPSDHPNGMGRSFRVTPQHAMDIAAVIAWVKNRSSAPIWLVGTSNGSISAAEGATLGPPVHGVVLTSAVWRTRVQQEPLPQIKVLVLVVHNRSDSCRLSPYSGTASAMAAMQQAPLKELLTVSGGSLRGKPCEALSPHGYFGIENAVVPPIIAWIAAH